jgi:hypothetical protein
VDLLRARALLDDDLAELSDAEREWVWRSLLKGIRVDEACVVALLELDRLDEALAAVRARYEQRARRFLEAKAQLGRQLTPKQPMQLHADPEGEGVARAGM